MNLNSKGSVVLAYVVTLDTERLFLFSIKLGHHMITTIKNSISAAFVGAIMKINQIIVE